MKKIQLLYIIVFFSSYANGQTAVSDKILYGSFQSEQLQELPYSTWYVTNKANYNPDAGTVSAIKKLDLKNIRVEIFLGTWCGDSKREVPRFLKLIDTLGIPLSSVKLIGVGTGDSLTKQSPAHEEKGKAVFRVPVFIIYRNGEEINRINEYPATSLEKDLLAILRGQPYTPNYRSFTTVKNWLRDGTLLDKNISVRGMAGQVRMLVANEHELNSLGYLLLKQDLKPEAVKICQINASLYPESANVSSSLGEIYLATGDKKNAIQWLEHSIGQNKDPALLKSLLDLLYQAKN